MGVVYAGFKFTTGATSKHPPPQRIMAIGLSFLFCVYDPCYVMLCADTYVIQICILYVYLRCVLCVICSVCVCVQACLYAAIALRHICLHVCSLLFAPRIYDIYMHTYMYTRLYIDIHKPALSYPQSPMLHICSGIYIWRAGWPTFCCCQVRPPRV
jgi:hypothetical protein